MSPLALLLPAVSGPRARCCARLRAPALCFNARQRAELLRLGGCEQALLAAAPSPALRRRRWHVVAAAAPKRAEPKTTRGVQRRKAAPPEPDGPRWRFFDLEPYLFRWQARRCARLPARRCALQC